MKNKIILLAAFMAGMAVVISLAATTAYHERSGRSSAESDLMCAVVLKGSVDINDTTTELTILDYSTLERVVIDANGIDTEFKVYIYDTSTVYKDVILFSKVDCNSMELPYSYALSQADTAANYFIGIPVLGPVSVHVADVNDTTLNALEVQIYYRRCQ